MLTPYQAVGYLIDRGLLDPGSVVAGGVQVIDASRRNRTFQVIGRQGPSYIVKQSNTPEAALTVAHEAAAYRLLRSGKGRDKSSSSFCRYLPRFYGYDPKERILILESIRDAKDIRQYNAFRWSLPKSAAASMGMALGALHSLPLPKSVVGRALSFPERVPWALTIHRPPLELFRAASAGNLEVIRTIQNSGNFCDLLDDLRGDWRADSLIHGDIRLDNWLVFPKSSSSRRLGLKLIDWEFASRGDPCWDAGSFFSGCLSLWLLSVPIAGRESTERILKLSRYPLEGMQPALRSFWMSYRSRTNLDPSSGDQWLLKATRYAGARLVQTAIEQTKGTPDLTGNIAGLLQLSLNMLQRPREAATLLLGCPPRRRS